MAKRTERTFEHDGKKRSVKVTTKLTDDEAIKLLGGIDGDSFNAKCAFEINKMKEGYRAAPGLVAWGFHNAENPRKKFAPTTLALFVQHMVACRRPLAGEIEGHPFKVVQHGARSRHCGQYTVTDGAEYPDNEYYGRASEEGEWKPTGATPQAIVDHLTTEALSK